MFERFTGLAKRAIVRSEQEAISRGRDYIGTEHLLLGLAGVPEGLAAAVLSERGLTAERLRQEVTRLPDRPGSAAAGHAEALATIGIDVDEIRRRADASFGSGRFVFPRPAYSPRAKDALIRSLSEAETLGDQDIDTQHVLLGLLADGEGRAVTALRALGADPAQLRAALLSRPATA